MTRPGDTLRDLAATVEAFLWGALVATCLIGGLQWAT